MDMKKVYTMQKNMNFLNKNVTTELKGVSCVYLLPTMFTGFLM